MSLRAHWNLLGVTSLTGVGSERYLYESYSIAGAAVIPLFAVLLLVVIAGLAVAAFVRFLPAPAYRIARQLRRALPWLLLVLLAASQLAILRALSRGGGDCSLDVVLGDLHVKQQKGCFERPDETLFFYGVLTLCAAVLVARARSNVRGVRAVWTAAEVAAIVLALQLPILYGKALKPPLYPAVGVVRANGETQGLLVLSSPTALELWTVQNGRGQMLVIPSGGIQTIRSGEVRNVFEVARKALDGDTAFRAALGLGP